jgi:serpin B
MRPVRSIIALLALVAACDGAHAPTPSQEVLTARQLPAAIQADATAVVQANNQFACDLYTKLATGDGNLFFSPFSISTALAMVDAGAAGTTDAELRQTLGFTLPGDRLHAAYGALLHSLDTGRGFGAYTLATADRLFGQQGFAFQPAFLAITKDDYGAELQPVDFIGDAEAARTTINQWVSDQTDAKIPELFGAGSLDSSTRLALANAILFKGTWQTQFKPADTSNAPFARADGTSVTAPLMSKQDSIATASIPGGRLGILPFRGQDLSMIILLPDAPGGLPALEAQLAGAALAQWIGAAATLGEDVEVVLPKFGVTSSFDLGGVLQALGIVSAFDPTTADLSGMDGQRDLFIQTAIHKAVVTVDEEGAEAAAATGIGVGTSSAPMPFSVDHPFLFLIYDNVTGSVLFLGRVTDPTQ